MSASEAAVLHPVESQGRQPEERPPLQRLAEFFTPKQGWDTFVMLVAAVGVAAWSVREADWTETPGLMRIVLWSCLAGLLLAKARAPWPLLHTAGLAVGLVVVVWHGLAVSEGQSLADRLSDFWDRLSFWYEAASTGGISTDLLPFTLAVLTITWLMGYLSSWFLIRRTNVWVGLVLVGTALLTNLSFLPDDFTTQASPVHVPIEVLFFLFMFLAMMMVIRVSMVQQLERWRRLSIGTISSGRLLTVFATVGLSVVVLALAAGLPLKVYVSRTAADVWSTGRGPVASLEDEFARLFSGVKARKDLTGRFFGKTLPFQGKISPDGSVVLWARSEHPSYWLSRSYSQYTSKGWIAGESKRQTVGPDALPPPPQESFKRRPVFQRLYLSFDTDVLLSGGNLDWVSRETVVETLAPMSFEIDLRDPSGDAQFPEDVRNLAGELRRVLGESPSDLGEASISQMLPIDLALVSVHPQRDEQERLAPEKVTIERKEPTLPDVVAWKFADRFKAGETYAMRSYVSDAGSDDLRAAGTNYSGFLKDHYLQFPASLPRRVSDLASELTREAETPLDKALAIQDYLRGPTFEYSQDIEKPPRDADGVDYFLFQTRKGYSDYFASAMAIMLRSAGVPARLAAGYGPGELQDGISRRAVRDSDSHGWTQVYFPGHGWIDFEPTPRWAILGRGAPQSFDDDAEELLAANLEDDTLSSGEDEFPLELCDVPEGFFPEFFVLDQPCETGESSGVLSLDDLLLDGPEGPRFPLMILAISSAVVAAAVWLMGRLMWTRGLARISPAERAYTKMGRLGTLAGLGRRRHQTPFEYATALGSAIPAIAAGAQSVAWAYTVGRYGRKEPTEGEPQDLGDPDEDWRSIRSGLLATALRRLAPKGKR